MKYLVGSFIFLSICVLASAQQQVQVKMGEGFSYHRKETFSEILFGPGLKDTVVAYFASNENDSSAGTPIPRVAWVVISHVSYFGFNSNFILATSKNKTGTDYWVIDKKGVQEASGLTKDETRMKLSNVNRVKERKFLRLQKANGIKLSSVEDNRPPDDKE